MSLRQLLLISASAFFILTLPCEAGPCSNDIERMQMDIDARLNALAAAGPTEKQGIGAQIHRQPTPLSVAEAESEVGSLSPSLIEQVKGAMNRARKADAAGEKSACESALNDVDRMISKQ